MTLDGLALVTPSYNGASTLSHYPSKYSTEGLGRCIHHNWSSAGPCHLPTLSAQNEGDRSPSRRILKNIMTFLPGISCQGIGPLRSWSTTTLCQHLHSYVVMFRLLLQLRNQRPRHSLHYQLSPCLRQCVLWCWPSWHHCRRGCQVRSAASCSLPCGTGNAAHRLCIALHGGWVKRRLAIL